MIDLRQTYKLPMAFPYMNPTRYLRGLERWCIARGIPSKPVWELADKEDLGGMKNAWVYATVSHFPDENPYTLSKELHRYLS
jgi:hypothetical protein